MEKRSHQSNKMVVESVFKTQQEKERDKYPFTELDLDNQKLITGSLIWTICLHCRILSIGLEIDSTNILLIACHGSTQA